MIYGSWHFSLSLSLSPLFVLRNQAAAHITMITLGLVKQHMRDTLNHVVPSDADDDLVVTASDHHDELSVYIFEQELNISSE